MPRIWPISGRPSACRSSGHRARRTDDGWTMSGARWMGGCSTRGCGSNSEFVQTMKQPALPAIALLAAAIICVQNFPVLTGVSWAVIHGAGVLSALGFVPAAIALAVLWAGYRVIQSRVTSQRYDLRAIYDTIAKEGGGPCAR